MIASKPKVINNKYAKMAKRVTKFFEKHNTTFFRLPHGYISLKDRHETIEFIKCEPDDRHTFSAPKRELFLYWNEKQNRPAWGINTGALSEADILKMIAEMENN